MEQIQREFDALTPVTPASRVVIERASADQLTKIYPRFSETLAQRIATLETCERIRRHHMDNLWAILDRRESRLVGLYAMAMLSPEGHRALLSGSFEADDPRLAHVAATGEPVGAIYKWGVYAPGIAAAAIPLIADRLRAPDYRHLDLYGNGSTDGGRRIMKSLGFRSVGGPDGVHLYRYERLANRPPSSPDIGFPF